MKVPGGPGGKVAAQTVPQWIPACGLVTVPVPVPDSDTVSVGKAAIVNVAETDVLLFKVTWHSPVPLQAPPHPPKTKPEAGVGVKVTWVPIGKLAPQTLPQLIPAGVLVTVPDPESVTVRVGNPAFVNEAETDMLLFTVTLHVPVPLQAPFSMHFCA